MYGYFSAKEVCRLTAVSYRQLAYWVDAGVVKAEIGTQGGSRRRRYSFEDVVIIRALATFIKAGVRPIAMKATVERLRQELRSAGSGIQTLANTRLFTDGKAMFKFEPVLDALLCLDGSNQLAFAFDWGAQLTELLASLENRPRRVRYETRATKAA